MTLLERGFILTPKTNKHKEKQDMTKKTIIISVLFGILLLGVVSAGIVDYLSNRITGTVTVNGPMFYAGKTSEGNLHLWINDFSKFQEENKGEGLSITGTETETFFTDKLDEMGFYNPEIEMQVKAKLIEGTAPKELEIEFGYFDNFPDGTIHKIGNCEKKINITSTTDYETQSITCQGGGTISHLRGFYYSISGRGTGGVEININLNDGETKTKILGVLA